MPRQSAGLWRGKHPEDHDAGTVSADGSEQFYQRDGLRCARLPRRGAGVPWCRGLFWLSTEPVILQRLRRASCPLPFVPRSGSSLRLPRWPVARFSVNGGGEADTFAKMLFGYGLLQLLFMLRLMPWYLSQPFNASFWSFSFGVSALATTGLSWAEQSVRVLSCPRCSPVYFHQRHHRDAAGPYFYLADAGQTSGAR